MGTRLMAFLTLVWHVMLGNRLDAETTFVVIALYNTVAFPVIGVMPYAISSIAEVLVACKRIQVGELAR